MGGHHAPIPERARPDPLHLVVGVGSVAQAGRSDVVMRSASELDRAEEEEGEQKQKILRLGAQGTCVPPPRTAEDPASASASATPAPAPALDPLRLSAASLPSEIVTAPAPAHAPPLRSVSHSAALPAVAAVSGSSTPSTTTTMLAGSGLPSALPFTSTSTPATPTTVAAAAAARHWAPWTREEERRILELREKRVKVATIAEMMQRTLGAVTGRLKILRKQERVSLGGSASASGGGEFGLPLFCLLLFAKRPRFFEQK